MFRKILFSFGILLAVAIGVLALLIAVNIKDEKIQPEYRVILDYQPPAIPKSAVDGFKFLLGSKVADADQDPYEKGEELYQAALNETKAESFADYPHLPLVDPMPIPSRPHPINGTYINKEKWAETKSEVETYITQTTKLIERFNKLLTYQSYALDQKPTFSFLGTPINRYYMLSQIKMAQLIAQLHQGKSNEFLTGLVQINNFAARSLQYPDTILGTMVNIAIIKSVRDILKEASVEYPKLKESIARLKIEQPPTYEAIVQNTLFIEASFAYHIFTGPLKFDDFILSNINGVGDPQDKWLKFFARNLNWAMPLFYKPIATFNLFMSTALATVYNPCIKTDVPCNDEPPVKTTFVERNISNPVGVRMSQVFATSAPRFKKMYSSLKSIQQAEQ